MKHTLTLSAFTLFILLPIVLSACGAAEGSVWENATYRENTTIGSGSLSFELEVEAENSSVVLSVRTDETNLGKALQNLGLISGEESAFGLYVKTVNGISADYDTDKTYWVLYENEKMSTVGVSDVTVTNGTRYGFVRTK